MVTIQDFSAFDIVVAKIKKAEEHPNADKLLVLKVDIGAEERQLVAGIRKSYSPEQLEGKQIVMIANLEPAVIRGVESQGMLLAASDETGISLLCPDKEISLGSKVR